MSLQAQFKIYLNVVYLLTFVQNLSLKNLLALLHLKMKFV